MTAPDLAFWMFAIINTVRILAYVPQIVCIARDESGAEAVSYMSWGLFGASNLATAVYGAVSMRDWTMASVFFISTLCCVAIIALTALKRRQARRFGPRMARA